MGRARGAYDEAFAQQTGVAVNEAHDDQALLYTACQQGDKAGIVALAVGGNQHVREARFTSMPIEALRAIMWRSPSLQRIGVGRGSVTRDEDGLVVRPAAQAGDRVRVLGTEGDWEVAGGEDDVELEGREGTVPSSMSSSQARATWRGRRPTLQRLGVSPGARTCPGTPVTRRLVDQGRQSLVCRPA